MLDVLPASRRDALCQAVTIDIDATDVEVYGRRKRGVAYNYQGQRCGRPDVATWAQTETVPAADVLDGDQIPAPAWSRCWVQPQPHSTQTPNICASSGVYR